MRDPNTVYLVGWSECGAADDGSTLSKMSLLLGNEVLDVEGVMYVDTVEELDGSWEDCIQEVNAGEPGYSLRQVTNEEADHLFQRRIQLPSEDVPEDELFIDSEDDGPMVTVEPTGTGLRWTRDDGWQFETMGTNEQGTWESRDDQGKVRERGTYEPYDDGRVRWREADGAIYDITRADPADFKWALRWH